MGILHIGSFSIERPNGIKTVLDQLIPIQQKTENVELINLKTDKIITLKEKKIIIFHGIYNFKYLLIYRKIKNKIPYIIVPHCSLTKISLKQKSYKKKLYNFMAKNFYKNALAIGYLNEEERNTSIKVNKNYIYLPNGVEVPKNIVEKVDNKISIFYLSRIDIFHKGIDLLLEALQIIKIDLIKKQIKINIYGDGDKKNMDIFFSKIKKYGIEEIINYKGRVEGDKKENAFQENDIFILTSRFEGFPMAVLEALSYGKPCILTTGTNMKNIIEKFEAGWISDVNSKNIAETIIKAIKEYEVNKKLFINNAKKTSYEYTWEKIVTDHIKSYKQLLEMELNNDCI